MEDFDLEAFIVNIEESAPKEERFAHDRCQECDTTLEEIEGNYICPSCSTQATNILQLEQSELHLDETGNLIYGQRVLASDRDRRKHTIDYGWAWSTDEAIVHILSLQVNALEKAGLLPPFFREAISNMWFKFWLNNIAIFIHDEYDENEFVPIKTMKSLKYRDIEVLFKVRDKVMIPKRLVKKERSGPKRAYKMMGTNFYRSNSNIQAENNSDPTDQPIVNSSEDHIDQNTPKGSIQNSDSEDVELIEGSKEVPEMKKTIVKTLDRDSVLILTLNRTLAFIEATARCLNCPEPLFASDILRACNQRLIPFYGAARFLPDGMKINLADRLVFQKFKPPCPIQLSRAASLLVYKIYEDRMPFLTPVPNLNRILERFVEDLNLPYDILGYLKGTVDFSSFKRTRPMRFRSEGKRSCNFPQYDRWAFAILLCQLKRLFGLDDKSIDEQHKLCSDQSKQSGEKLFIFYEWIRQMSVRLKLILSYDPFVLLHPMANVQNIQPTPQVYNYVETFLEDKLHCSTRISAKRTRFDDSYRSDLADFLKKEIPRPSHLCRSAADERELEKPVDLRHPIQDALNRTRRFWISEMSHDTEISDILFKDFTLYKILTLEKVNKWSIYGDRCPSNMKLEIAPEWPYCFKILLSVGGYLCYCRPKQLLREVRVVEEFLYPHLKVVVKSRKFQQDENDESPMETE
mgnify:CR=1 FL=1